MKLEVRAGAIAWRGMQAAVGVSGIETEAREGAALYLLVTGCNLPGVVAAEVFGCSKQYISKVLRQVEDRREDAVFDAALSALERDVFGEG